MWRQLCSFRVYIRSSHLIWNQNRLVQLSAPPGRQPRHTGDFAVNTRMHAVTPSLACLPARGRVCAQGVPAKAWARGKAEDKRMPRVAFINSAARASWHFHGPTPLSPQCVCQKTCTVTHSANLLGQQRRGHCHADNTHNKHGGCARMEMSHGTDGGGWRRGDSPRGRRFLALRNPVRSESLMEDSVERAAVKVSRTLHSLYGVLHNVIGIK